jgi:NLR family CARD domain-containing protein 3
MSETTAVSTHANFHRGELVDDSDENIWADSKDSKKATKNEFIGEEAFLNYYKKFRKVSQDPQRYENWAQVEFIKRIEKEGMPPAPFGLIKRNGNPDEINVKHYNIGNRYGRALGSSLKHIRPKIINLCGNKNWIGISSIIKNLNDNLESLDLSTNLISLKSIIDLCNYMSLKSLGSKLTLRQLNLSNNRLSDDMLLVLWNGLKTAKPDLKNLDLSKNMMADFSAYALGEYLDHAHYIQVLNLGWNRITSFGGTRIFQGIREGRSCRSINFSYNLLGKSESFELVESVQLAISEETVKHLDLSFNRMSLAVSEKLGMLIMDNHSLYGIHMEGNKWYVDKFGFIQTDKNLSVVDHAKHKIIYPETSNGYSTTIKFSKENKHLYRPSSNWWVCEGWTEQTFEFTLGKSFPDIVDPVHIHFEYNLFKPELMKCK